MSTFVVGIPAPEALDSGAYRVRVVVDRIDGADLTPEDVQRIEAVYPRTLTEQRPASPERAAQSPLAWREEPFEFIKTDEPEILARQLRLARMIIARDQEMAFVMRQFERKLGRPLDGDENRAFHEHWRRLGPIRLSDVAVDLKAAGLAAWLADPAAK